MRKRSLIYDGWLTRYKVNRVLDDYEVQNRISRRTAIKLPPIDKGLVKINSVFVECVDRYFFCAAGQQWGVHLWRVYVSRL